jgi:hypothetical protein
MTDDYRNSSWLGCQGGGGQRPKGGPKPACRLSLAKPGQREHRKPTLPSIPVALGHAPLSATAVRFAALDVIATEPTRGNQGLALARMLLCNPGAAFPDFANAHPGYGLLRLCREPDADRRRDRGEIRHRCGDALAGEHRRSAEQRRRCGRTRHSMTSPNVGWDEGPRALRLPNLREFCEFMVYL